VIITGMIRAGSSGFHKPGYFTIAYWKVMQSRQFSRLPAVFSGIASINNNYNKERK